MGCSQECALSRPILRGVVRKSLSGYCTPSVYDAQWPVLWERGVVQEELVGHRVVPHPPQCPTNSLSNEHFCSNCIFLGSELMRYPATPVRQLGTNRRVQ